MAKVSDWSDEAPCPEARMLASRHDLMQAKRFVTQEAFSEIEKGLVSSRTSEQIAAAVELRKLITAHHTPARLRQSVANLRARYRVALTPPGTPPDNTVDNADLATATNDELLAEADSLLERLKTVYTVSSLRDAQVARFRSWTLYILGGLLLILLCTRLPQVMPWEWLRNAFAVGTPIDTALNMAVIALFGAIGAMVSIMRRSQQALDLGPIDIDPIRQISALRHGFSGMLIAAMVGPVFALVLFGVFASGMLIIAGLTPDFVACPPNPDPEGEGLKPAVRTCTFVFLNAGYNFATAADAAKMAIWAFLAGFAERLVPDVLDKFIKAAEAAPVGAPPASPVTEPNGGDDNDDGNGDEPEPEGEAPIPGAPETDGNGEPQTPPAPVAPTGGTPAPAGPVPANAPVASETTADSGEAPRPAPAGSPTPATGASAAPAPRGPARRRARPPGTPPPAGS